MSTYQALNYVLLDLIVRVFDEIDFVLLKMKIGKMRLSLKMVLIAFYSIVYEYNLYLCAVFDLMVLISLCFQANFKFITKISIAAGMSVDQSWKEWKNVMDVYYTMHYCTFWGIVAWNYSPPLHIDSVEILRHLAAVLLVTQAIAMMASKNQKFRNFKYQCFFFPVDENTTDVWHSVFFHRIENWAGVLLTLRLNLLYYSVFSWFSNAIFTWLVHVPFLSRCPVDSEQDIISSSTTVEFDNESDDSNWPTVRSKLTTIVSKLVQNAKPHVRRIVQNTQKSVVNLAAIADENGGELVQAEIPLDMYDINVIGSLEDEDSDSTISSSPSLPKFILGEPLKFQFTGCRETMTERDWVGVYYTTQNFDTRITTSLCGPKWTYLAKTSVTDVYGFEVETQDKVNDRIQSNTVFSKRQSGGNAFGTTPVKITKSDRNGLRSVNGTLTLDESRIPWKIGEYELRYHFNGGYHVIKVSRPFLITLDGVLEHGSINIQSVQKTMQRILWRCLGLESSKLFSFQIPILDQIKCKKDATDRKQRELIYAERICYVVDKLYGVKFGVGAIGERVATGQILCERIVEAVELLDK